MKSLCFVSIAALALSIPSAEAAGPPLTPWGEPDLQGVWDFRTITPLERPSQFEGKEFLTDEEATALKQRTLEILNNDVRTPGSVIDVERAYNHFWLDYGTELTPDQRTSLIVDPPDGRIPALTPEAVLLARASRGKRPVRQRVVFASGPEGPEDRGLSERCILGFNSGPPFVPMPYNNNIQIFQTPNTVALLNEMVHDVRVIPLDGRAHLAADIPQWMGDSRGHWQGSTLVVETTNFSEKNSFSGSLAAPGAFGETYRLTERFTRVDEETLLYEFTVEDPTWWTRAWTAVIPMKKGQAIIEYACHEGNRGMSGMLSGARAQERAAEEASK
jgi:hypothetical protein